MVRLTLLLFALFPLVFGAKELLEENGLQSDDKDPSSDDVMVKRSVNDIAARRRSALDKNFMRFGRSDPEFKFRSTATTSRNPCPKKNCLRYKRYNNNLMRFGRANNLVRFGRSGNLMRFGRGNNNLMRFGRSGNLMRFGRSADDFDTFDDDCNCPDEENPENQLDDDEQRKIDEAIMRFAKIISNRPTNLETEPDNLSEIFPDDMRKKRSLKSDTEYPVNHS